MEELCSHRVQSLDGNTKIASDTHGMPTTTQSKDTTNTRSREYQVVKASKLQHLYIYPSAVTVETYGFQRNIVMLKLGNSKEPSPFHSDSLMPTFSLPSMLFTFHESPVIE